MSTVTWDGLYEAAELGNINLVRIILNRGDGGKKSLALCGAALYGHIDTVKILLERGADVNKFALLRDTVERGQAIFFDQLVYQDLDQNWISKLETELLPTSKPPEVIEEQRQQQYQQQFTAGIAKNVETPFNITITVVGHKGVGKSCFVKQLQKEYIPEGGPGSTDTADFYVNYLGFNPKTGFRKKLDENGEEETGRHRIKRIIDQYLEGEKQETSSLTAAPIPTPGHADPDNRNTPLSIDTEAPRPESSSSEKTSDQPSSSSLKRKKSLTLELSFKKRKILPINRSQQENTTRPVELSPQQKNTIEEIMDTKTDEPMKGFITIYDFGGEEVFYNTHHCLMSDNMVFVLVVDVAMCLDPYKSKEGYDRIEFWLRSFATYAVDHAVSGEGTPPVILIGSHLDVVSPDKETQNKAFVKVLKKLYDNPQLRKIMETHVQDMYPISHLNDSSKNHSMYEIIWKRLVEIAPLQSRWGKPVPARWLALEHQIVKCKRKGDVILTYNALKEINSKSAVPLAEEDIPDFLRNLQLAGTFLCFDHEGENAFVILKPQWIINAFRSIITDPKFTAALTTKLKLQWTQYERSGEIKIDFIRRLWGLHEGSDFLSDEKRIFRAMETLGLLAKPLSDEPNEDIDYYIVPSMLQPAKPEIVRSLLEDPETIITVTLCLKFDNPFIPQAVWDKMIATCIHRFQGLQEYGHDGTDFFQRGFVCLSVDFQWNMIINCSKNVMKVTMFKKDKDPPVPTGAGVNLLGILQFHLNRILELNHQSHLRYQFYLHNDYRFTDNDKMVRVDDLRKTRCLKCHSSNDSRWIERQEIFVWFKRPCQKTKRIPSDQVNVVNALPDRNLSVKEVGRVSKYIGTSLQTFFVELKCPYVVIEQKIAENWRLSCRTLITKIFIHLLNAEADVGFTKVADAMTEHGMNPASLFNILDDNRETIFNDENLPRSCLLKCLTEHDAQVIATCVSPKEYFVFFLELGFSPKRIDEFDINYRTDQIANQITAMMKEFVKTRMPTLNTVLLAMQECDMDTQCLLEGLSSL
ncbi:uncharacterized protein [Argopecten irradians]|uniref:uncharacterized protein isoform X2 n=1 Tax=Argopecten irradians TaxID=31199 RepID=UPI003717365A